MKIGIISDTHDYLESTESAITRLAIAGFTTILHAGDWTKPATVKAIAELTTALGIFMIGVWGNNDRELDALETIAGNYGPTFSVQSGIQKFQLCHITFALYHGHHKPTLQQLMASKIDVLVRGHSHVPLNQQTGSLQILNPGSTAFSIPRRRGWLPTMMIYDIDKRATEIISYEA